MATRLTAPAGPCPPCCARRLGFAGRGLRALLLLGLVSLAAAGAAGVLPEWLARGEGDVLQLVAVCGAYAVLLAIPFVPAVEIGLMIMLVFGPLGALGAYLATIAGLNLAFVAGRTPGVRGALRGLAPRLPTALRPPVPPVLARVLLLALLLNMPGNSLLGGGGGIAMAAGAGGRVGWPTFVCTVVIATAAVPLLFALGVLGLEHLALSP